MQPRIQQLAPGIITKIAAGEVIERPASVLKELLENSIDAGSTHIEIDAEQGGVELLRVVDNGCGIVEDDLRLAFASHATSKLRTDEDLFRIGTLGFRGEALASIGSVAQVTLQSRPLDAPNGAMLTCRGGELSACQPWNGSTGTRIEVRSLFFNTPVRKKFLRTTATEIGHLTEIFQRLALAYPAIELVLRHNGKEVYTIPASASLLDRLEIFFGKSVRDQLYPIDVTQGNATLSGYISDPACDRPTQRMHYFFVNGRWIRDRSLSHALQEGYRGLLMSGRYAVGFLFIQVPSCEVDVNVHPTKVEVRFQDNRALHHLVFAGVREVLQSRNLTPRLLPPAPPPATTWQATPQPWTSTATSIDPPPWHQSKVQAPPGRGDDSMPLFVESKTPERASTASSPQLSSKVIQLHETYLVLETEDGMLVIDQHALHESILYEQLQARIGEGSLEVQPLLIPDPMDMAPEQAAKVLEHREALACIGIGVESFGGGTVLLTSYPAMLSRYPPRKIFTAIVDYLVKEDRPPSREALLKNLLSVMACHSAVRAGDRLNREEMDALLAMRHLANQSHHCPHGRPTSLLFSRHDLEKQFRRT